MSRLLNSQNIVSLIPKYKCIQLFMKKKHLKLYVSSFMY